VRLCDAERREWQQAPEDKGRLTGMPETQTRAERIQAVLTAAFSPALIRVRDDSLLHVGHAGARPEGETHYSVLIVSPAFRGMNRVARSRAVHAAVEPEFAGGLHALALTLRTPEEQAARGEG
jgi:BolA protein